MSGAWGIFKSTLLTVGARSVIVTLGFHCTDAVMPVRYLWLPLTNNQMYSQPCSASVAATTCDATHSNTASVTDAVWLIYRRDAFIRFRIDYPPVNRMKGENTINMQGFSKVLRFARDTSEILESYIVSELLSWLWEGGDDTTATYHRSNV